MKSEKIYKNNKGFTLLETIVAVAIIVIGLVSILALINTALFYVFDIQDRLIAANLVQEGIEITRNIRDNKWLQNLNWNSGLTDGDHEAVYNLNYLSSYTDRTLSIDSSGFYNYISGSATPYKRKISITNLSSYEIKIVSIVTWQRRGVNYTGSAEEHLFNWK